MLKLRMKEGSLPYHTLLRGMSYALQGSLREDLDSLQKLQIIAPLDVDEMSKLCNSFVLVPKANGKVWLYLDPARLNKVPIRPVPLVLTLNDNLPRLAGFMYLTFIDASLGYDNLKFDEQSLYVTTFACQFGRYGYIKLLYGAVLTSDMFQRKIDKLFQGLPSVFGIADDI